MSKLDKVILLQEIFAEQVHCTSECVSSTLVHLHGVSGSILAEAVERVQAGEFHLYAHDDGTYFITSEFQVTLHFSTEALREVLGCRVSRYFLDNYAH